MFVHGKRFPKQASIWSNPFKVGKDGTRDEVLAKYERYISAKLDASHDLVLELKNLENHNLGCWCVDSTTEWTPGAKEVCHGQVLLRLMKKYIS